MSSNAPPPEQRRERVKHLLEEDLAQSGMYPDKLVTVLLGMAADRPVRSVSRLSEHLLFTLQGRYQINLIDATFNDEGIISALRVHCIHNSAAYRCIQSRRRRCASRTTQPEHIAFRRITLSVWAYSRIAVGFRCSGRRRQWQELALRGVETCGPTVHVACNGDRGKGFAA